MLPLDNAEDCSRGLALALPVTVPAFDRCGHGRGYDFGLATISKSSTSKTSVAPGLIVGGAPLSP